MKDQYYGDVNDYRKYGILRSLTCLGKLRTGVCWMLTPPDGRTDGQAIRYLSNPQTYRTFDPVLFDHLSNCVLSENDRRVARIEFTDILPNSLFHSALLQDGLEHRVGYFNGMLESFASCDLIFFDPDNGIEVPSVACGRRSSSKFLYWSEVDDAYRGGHSLLIYQHFPREERVSYTRRLANRLLESTSSSLVISFRTSHVLFLLASQPRHASLFRTQANSIAKHWAGCNITVSEHVTSPRTTSIEPSEHQPATPTPSPVTPS